MTIHAGGIRSFHMQQKISCIRPNLYRDQKCRAASDSFSASGTTRICESLNGARQTDTGFALRVRDRDIQGDSLGHEADAGDSGGWRERFARRDAQPDRQTVREVPLER